MEAKLVESSAHQPTLLDLLWDHPNEVVKGGGQSTALERFISGYENKSRGGTSRTASTCSLLDSELDDDLFSIENENETRSIFNVMASNGIITARLADECLCFTGHFSHPDFGELLPVEVSLHTSTRGTWTIQEQTEPISVKFENDRLVFFEKDGPTQFRVGSHHMTASQVGSAPFCSSDLEPGDAVLFDGRIVHRGGPRSEEAGARHALYFVYHKWWYQDNEMDVADVCRVESLRDEEISKMEAEEPWLKQRSSLCVEEATHLGCCLWRSGKAHTFFVSLVLGSFLGYFAKA